ncbi:MAG: hypothetical protein M1834_009341 [Cirrosporium novae-zelandiae]|nr:MAG: hypothetical protein M1834_009341 [Cirrosporium novae-zelandiae]
MFAGNMISPLCTLALPLTSLKFRRKRASTRDILGSEYQEIITEVLASPKPEKNAQDYDGKRLREGLKYADSILRSTECKLSPLDMRAVLLYKDAVINLLDLGENVDPEQDEELENAKEVWLTIVRMHEESARGKECLILTNSSDSQTLQDEIIKLQRISFFARYGDVFVDVCQKLGTNAEAQKVLGWRALTGSYWTEINTRLMTEKETWKVLDEEDAQCPVHAAIFDTGLSVDEMVEIVQLYATKNQIVDANLAILIKNGQFDDLKRRLYNDFSDLPRVISAVEGAQARLFSTLLQTMMDSWFMPNKEDPDNLQLWKPTKELEASFTELQNKGIQGDIIYKKMMQKITTDVAKRLKDEAREQGLVEELETTNLGLPSSNKRGKKRGASAQLQAEAKRAKGMMSDWRILTLMTEGVYYED